MLFVSLIAHRICRRGNAERKRGLILGVLYFYARVSVPKVGRSRKLSGVYFQLAAASRGCEDLQKITRSFVYARQFSRFRIQSVTNSERRRNSGRCGFSSELANAALRRRIQIRSSCMWLQHIPTCTHTYTYLGFLPLSLPPLSRPGVPVRVCPPATGDRDVPEVAATNVRPPTIDRGSLSMWRDRLLRFGLSRGTKERLVIHFLWK